MARVIEGTPGEAAEVWIQDKGASSPRLRGRIVVEDLSEVLTCISSRNGANGPNNPVTQYILAEAAQYLAERLIEDANPAVETVPRTLSGALGHQPFIESVLNMSQHQMLRRWPLATDWYQDVINYVMRPQRFAQQTANAQARFAEWTKGSMGEFMRKFSDSTFDTAEDPKVLRVAEALQSLWPDYPPVRNAMHEYRTQINQIWEPIYMAALTRYGLKPRPEVTLDEMAWAFNALHAREVWERLGDPSMAQHKAADGTPWTYTARGGIMLICGAVTDLDGNALTPTQLIERQPVVPLSEIMPDAELGNAS